MMAAGRPGPERSAASMARRRGWLTLSHPAPLPFPRVTIHDRGHARWNASVITPVSGRGARASPRAIDVPEARDGGPAGVTGMDAAAGTRNDRNLRYREGPPADPAEPADPARSHPPPRRAGPRARRAGRPRAPPRRYSQAARCAQPTPSPQPWRPGRRRRRPHTARPPDRREKFPDRRALVDAGTQISRTSRPAAPPAHCGGGLLDRLAQPLRARAPGPRSAGRGRPATGSCPQSTDQAPNARPPARQPHPQLLAAGWRRRGAQRPASHLSAPCVP